MTGTRAALTAVAALVGLLCAGSAMAAKLTMIGGLARTTGIIADGGEGGPSFEFGVLAPVRGVLAGLSVHVDDMGEETTQLRDPSGADLGTTQAFHVATFGWDVRVDAPVRLPLPGKAFLTGTTGMYRTRKDQLGETLNTAQAWGWSLGASWRFPLRKRFDLGPSARYHRVHSTDILGRYWLLGLEGTWH